MGELRAGDPPATFLRLQTRLAAVSWPFATWRWLSLPLSPRVGFRGDSVPVSKCHPQACADLCSHGQAHSFYRGVRTAWHSLGSRLAGKVFLTLASAFLVISYWTR